MNKSQLVEQISENTDVSKNDVDAVLTGLFSVVAEHVAKSDDKITIPGWISFQQTTRAARKGRNPRTGEELTIPETKGVKVSAGSKLKAAAKG